MTNDTTRTDVAQQYVAAHETHYQTKDLRESFALYKRIMADHPDTPEAGYARAQILNIVQKAVPKQDLLDAQMELARTHLEDEVPPDLEPVPVTPPALGQPI